MISEKSDPIDRTSEDAKSPKPSQKSQRLLNVCCIVAIVLAVAYAVHGIMRFQRALEGRGATVSRLPDKPETSNPIDMMPSLPDDAGWLFVETQADGETSLLDPWEPFRTADRRNEDRLRRGKEALRTMNELFPPVIEDAKLTTLRCHPDGTVFLAVYHLPESAWASSPSASAADFPEALIEIYRENGWDFRATSGQALSFPAPYGGSAYWLCVKEDRQFQIHVAGQPPTSLLFVYPISDAARRRIDYH